MSEQRGAVGGGGGKDGHPHGSPREGQPLGQEAGDGRRAVHTGGKTWMRIELICKSS